MGFSLPPEYVVQKFYQYAGYPKLNKHAGTYAGGCPVCREGSSWGKKRRLYYIMKDEYLFCQNCQKRWAPIDWIQAVSNMSFSEVLRDAESFEYIPPAARVESEEKKVVPTLPLDSINLFDAVQVDYWKKEKVIVDALDFIKKRNLGIAVNKPKSLWISMKDPVHKNRLVIPFYDEQNNITFYQTRAIYKDDERFGKYLSKTGSDKTIFNLQNVDVAHDNIFLFEGPIDACFVKNGVAVAGISLTDTQEESLQKYRFMNKIWVLDNQAIDNASKDKTMQLIDRGETVFIWPYKLKDFKDFNEISQKYNLGEISPRLITDNSFSGIKAKLALIASTNP